MAEAAVENMSSRFFCHQCSQETRPILPDFTCSRCLTGFIEEVTHSHDNEDSIDQSLFTEDDSESDQSFQDAHFAENFLDSLYDIPRFNNSQSSNQASSSTNAESDGSSRGRSESSGNQPRRERRFVQVRIPDHDQGDFNHQTWESIFQHFLSNVTGGQLSINNREGGTGRGIINIDMPFPLLQFLPGNPGDYAWGSGGLDAVITQLLNQLDGTGPPPMPKEEIDQIPTVSITQEQVDKNLQCTVCMEDFKVGEKVRQIACFHCYHNDCIVPWLELHGTCPICRKELHNRILNNGTNQIRSNSQQPNTSNSNSNHLSYEFPDDYD